MKTRSHSKRFMASMVFASILLQNPEALAQFNKYRSQTRFNPDKQEGATATPPPVTAPAVGAPAVAAPTDVESMSADDAAAALKAAEKVQTRAEAAPIQDIEADGAEDSAFTEASDDEANETTFGDRPSTALSAQPKNAKYVNLN